MTPSGLSPLLLVSAGNLRGWTRWLAPALLPPLLGSLLLAAEPAKRAFDLPSDTAEKSLKLFSRQAGLEVIFPSEIAKEVRTKPVKGAMTAREALAAMLTNTGLALFEDKTGAFTVRREGNDPNAHRAAPAKASDRPTS